ncbi:MAG: hypothetical protein ABI166_06860, partial [Mucilaginibacter sp.]
MIFKKRRLWFFAGGGVLLLSIIFIVYSRQSSHQQMIDMLKELAKKNSSFLNPLTPEAHLSYDDSILRVKGNEKNIRVLAEKAQLLVQTGQ